MSAYSCIFAGKKLKTQGLSKIFFSLVIHLGTKINLYSFERSLKWPFPSIFSFGVNKNHWLQNHAEPTCYKKSLWKNNFKAICHFCVNGYHTSAEGKSIPYIWASSCVKISAKSNKTKTSFWLQWQPVSYNFEPFHRAIILILSDWWINYVSLFISWRRVGLSTCIFISYSIVVLTKQEVCMG